MPRSGFEWPIFQLTINKSWVSIGATVFSDLYKRSTRRTNSKVKLFDDDSSLFSIINCVSTSASALNSDLSKIMDWPYQWKMSFKPDRTKQAKKKKKKFLQKEKRNYTSTTLFQQF